MARQPFQPGGRRRGLRRSVLLMLERRAVEGNPVREIYLNEMVKQMRGRRRYAHALEVRLPTLSTFFLRYLVFLLL